ncbi:hypothetical protein DJ533_12680 [Acinetobacter defluvii]|uniref:Morphogenetic protein n=1 Tax=Acinetobacter defluvii TaxID=1871111 RepID=A0A2S2FEJ3_9GAMM|nr:hypothetical protein [Acinetobacter defluvii]AWL29364.1 hypothetical protein DJ533_12680 [Acinetobacter defluvii]
MKERPILFSAPMVTAILESRKTQTRRVINPQPEGKTLQSNLDGKWLSKKFNGLLLPKIEDLPIHCPYGKIGDHLWVRETWSTVNLYGEIALAYKADCEVTRVVENESFQDEDGLINYDDPRLEKYSFAAWADDLLEGKEGNWKPSIHMPRWASRILLEITNIRVERLQDISESDCLKEGVGSPILRDCKKPKFMQLWEAINGADSWAANPWVWVVEFKVVKGGAV